jgi:hypothetical protein
MQSLCFTAAIEGKRKVKFRFRLNDLDHGQSHQAIDRHLYDSLNHSTLLERELRRSAKLRHSAKLSRAVATLPTPQDLQVIKFAFLSCSCCSFLTLPSWRYFRNAIISNPNGTSCFNSPTKNECDLSSFKTLLERRSAHSAPLCFAGQKK